MWKKWLKESDGVCMATLHPKQVCCARLFYRTTEPIRMGTFLSGSFGIQTDASELGNVCRTIILKINTSCQQNAKLIHHHTCHYEGC